MKVGFDRDMSIEIKFSRTLKAILGNYFIQKDIEQDLKKGTDFLIFTINPFKCGCRLRRFKYYQQYPDEFTIRYSRPSGVETEYQKILKGYVQYILYGFIDYEENKIIDYFIGDLEVFKSKPAPLMIKENNPPDSKLAVYKITQFPKEFILHKWSIMDEINRLSGES